MWGQKLNTGHFIFLSERDCLTKFCSPQFCFPPLSASSSSRGVVFSQGSPIWVGRTVKSRIAKSLCFKDSSKPQLWDLTKSVAPFSATFWRVRTNNIFFYLYSLKLGRFAPISARSGSLQSRLFGTRYPCSACQLPPGHQEIGPGCHSYLCQQHWFSKKCSVTASWGSRGSRYASLACQMPPDVRGLPEISPGGHSYLCQQYWFSKKCFITASWGSRGSRYQSLDCQLPPDVRGHP